ncbi:mitogen-activated protein kinase kinase kinase 17-like [Lolium rigidum]|uniref:mitogen-activated protein kinase kinase kinase 17-like n=1 Tax=Lolium rigidum TaxID=89674 RepID=UPI001F5C49B6|nr:mitogen-activated protein kinase kinase kinase 17-like [Lolium rigidum]
MAEISGRRRLTRLRTLGRGASGAVVSLFAADGGAGEDEQSLLAVKSAGAASAQAQLRREGGILASLCSPYVLPCLGSRAAAGGGEYQLFLEFAPGGSLADEVERNGGRLEEGAVRSYAADVARGLAYLHGESMVHGDVKGRNVVIGADGWAKLADFGCARSVGSAAPIGGTPAFMAPEVVRGEEQGPAADVWALGCTVIEMATGRAPWSGVDDVFAAVRLIGYTDAVPESPEQFSAEAKDFLDKCLRRRAVDRWTAAQLLEHPFLAFAGCGGDVEAKWVSPKSTLDAAMWESDGEEDDNVPDFTAEEENEVPDFTAERMKALAASYSVLPDWESDDGWIDVLSGQSEHYEAVVEETPADLSCSEAPDSPAAASTEEATSDRCSWDEALEAEKGVEEDRVVGAAVPVAAAPSGETAYDYDARLLEGGLLLEAETEAAAFSAGACVGDELVVRNVVVADNEALVNQQQTDDYLEFISNPIVVCVDKCDEEEIVNSLAMPDFIYLCFSSAWSPFALFFYNCNHISEHFV